MKHEKTRFIFYVLWNKIVQIFLLSTILFYYRDVQLNFQSSLGGFFYKNHVP